MRGIFVIIGMIFAGAACSVAAAETTMTPAKKYKLVGFKLKNNTNPKTIPFYEVALLNPNSSGSPVFSCDKVKKKSAPAAAMKPALSNAFISGVYHACGLVQLDFSGSRFWIKFDNLISNEPKTWQRFVNKNAKIPVCYANATSGAGTSAGKKQGVTRAFC